MQAGARASRAVPSLAALWIAIAGSTACARAEPPPSSPPVAAVPAPPRPPPEPAPDAPLAYKTSGLPPRASLRLGGSFQLGAHGGGLALAPSGRWLAVARGLTIDVIDLAAHPPRRFTLQHPGSRVESVAFSPDGTRVAVGFGSLGYPEPEQASVRLFDLESEQEVQRLQEKWVSSGVLAFSADGRRLLVAGSCVCLWNPADGKRVWAIDESDFIRHRFLSAVLSADGRVVVGLDEPPMSHTNEPDGSRAYFVKPARAFRWDPPSPVSVAIPDDGDPEQLALGTDGTRLLIASGKAPGLVVRELPGGREVARHPDPARTAALSPDGRMVAVAGLNRPIRLLTFPDLRERGMLEGHGRPEVNALAFSQDGRRLVSATSEEILVWELDASAAP